MKYILVLLLLSGCSQQLSPLCYYVEEVVEEGGKSFTKSTPYCYPGYIV